MAPGCLRNSTPHPLYFPEGHPQAGWFKGMEQILQEQGYDTKGLLAECKGFKCKAGQKDCCFSVIFLPKFHCELYFIEMCWGFAKRVYWLNPSSSKEANLERNVVAALDSIPVSTMHQFIGAYKHGLNGAQAAWAVKKYQGHRILPEGLMASNLR
ncbi:uncharacterized protein F5147DRAFT_583335 [Suillus discolor]|uniref:Uncharacterized protein n=1 Tax=Suillus discolor TaxID=1912936 RepID=A0A9P7EZM1_9AGAM|nr:uncharacterized protein F5147DRAFT_583335 [Suillus discolor]KAG2097950.1 hypothetical protein F5147DRAFT_583335 [Suillus discolor]